MQQLAGLSQTLSSLLAVDSELVEGRGHVSLITGRLVPSATVDLAVTKHSGSSRSQRSGLKLPEALPWAQMNFVYSKSFAVDYNRKTG